MTRGAPVPLGEDSFFWDEPDDIPGPGSSSGSGSGGPGYWEGGYYHNYAFPGSEVQTALTAGSAWRLWLLRGRFVVVGATPSNPALAVPLQEELMGGRKLWTEQAASPSLLFDRIYRGWLVQRLWTDQT